MKRFLLTFLLTVICSSAASAQSSDWEAALGTGDDFFPSFVLAMRNFDFNKIPEYKIPERNLGDPLGLVGIHVISEMPNTKVKVSVTVDGLSDPSTFETVLTKPNVRYAVMPFIRYKTDYLARIKQPFVTTAVIDVSINDAPSRQVTKKLNVHPVNDVPFRMKSKDRVEDTSILFAAFVNENAPVIDHIMKDALTHNAVHSFNGYAGDQQNVVRQVFAIWNSLQRKGIKYSNITTPSYTNNDFPNQHVRTPDEAYHNAQANCVDGSVLIASALYKIGLCPILILKPGHMYLGVHLNKEMCGKPIYNDVLFIETTVVGNLQLMEIQKNWIFQTEDGYRDSVSYSSLRGADEIAKASFRKSLPSILAKRPGYSVIDIKFWRDFGLTPIVSEAPNAQKLVSQPPSNNNSSDSLPSMPPSPFPAPLPETNNDKSPFNDSNNQFPF